MLAALLVLTVQSQAIQLPATFQQAWSRGDDSDTLVSLVGPLTQFVGIGPDSRVYIADRERGRVIVLDANGRTLGTLGRQGHGPGELANPVNLAVSPTGAVIVYDLAQHGFVGWSSQRRSLPLLPFKGRGIPNTPQALSDTVLLFQTISPDSARLYRLTPSSLSTIMAAPLQEPRRIGKEVCGVIDYSLPPIFTPSLVWTAWAGRPIVSYGERAELTESSSASPGRTWRAPHAPRPATRAMAIGELGETRTVVPGRPPCRFPPGRIVDAVGTAHFLSAYRRLIAASPTRLWAVRYTLKDEPALADLYDRATGYLGTVSLGRVRPIAFFPDGRLLSLETTEDDVPIVVAYTVTVSRP